MTDYANAESRLVNTGGGSVQVAIASNAGQGNGGTSLPCRVVLMNTVAGAGGYATLKIGSSTNASTGVTVPAASTGGYLEIAIDDIAKLYFYGSNDTDLVNITYGR